MAAHVLATTDPNNKNLRLTVIQTAVGEVAIEFVNWLDAQDLPDPQLVLDGKVTSIVDQARPDRTYAMVSSAISLAFQTLDTTDKQAQDGWNKGWTLLVKVKQDG